MPQIVHNRSGTAATTSAISLVRNGVATAVSSVWQVFNGATRLVWPPTEEVDEVDETALSIYEKAVFWADTAEASGSVAYEQVTSTHGTYDGVVDYNYGARGGAGKQFTTGSNDRCHFPEVAATQVAYDFTIASWFYATDTSSDQDIFARIQEGTLLQGVTMTKGSGGNTGKVVALINFTTRQLTSVASYPLNQWNMIVFDKAANGGGSSLERVILNNVVGGSDTQNGIAYGTGSKMVLGGYIDQSKGFGKGNTGGVAQLMVFSPKLTDAELTYLYNSGASRTWAEILEAAGIT